MRIPVISKDGAFQKKIAGVFDSINEAGQERKEDDPSWKFRPVPLKTHQTAIEYINYQTPPLLVLNFSDAGIDSFGIMKNIVADPWLNHGGIIAFYNDSRILSRINDLKETNIIISLTMYEVESLFYKVLGVIRTNQQILFQRAIQSEFTSSISGKFLLDHDIYIIPCYANLIANYLSNMGFIDSDVKSNIGLSLTEMLINAIEHGNCGITSEDKTNYMEEHGGIQELIEERSNDPKTAKKRVSFQYYIDSEYSTYEIADEGDGFEWRDYLDEEREVDFFSLHGRGILLTMHSIDEVKYNEKGNEVTLKITHRQNTANSVPLVFQDHETIEVIPGDVIFRQEEESDFLYYIAEGEFTVEVNDVKVSKVTPADILMGEMSFLLEETRSATVIASTAGKLVKISKIAFINSLKKQPYYGLFLARLLAKRLDRLGQAFTK